MRVPQLWIPPSYFAGCTTTAHRAVLAADRLVRVGEGCKWSTTMHRCVSAVSIAIMLLAGLGCVSVEAADFYMDALAGDDTHSGLSPATAWKTLGRAQHAELRPGDRLLLAGGQTFTGSLSFDRRLAGTVEQPIVIASYGDGHATISSGNASALVLDSCAILEIRGLTLVGSGRKAGNDGYGVKLWATTGILLQDLDISGFRLAGILAGGDSDTRMLHIAAHSNGFAGIAVEGIASQRTRNFLIRHCRSWDNPGDPQNLTNHSGNGIVVGEVEGGLIEWCEAFGNGWDMPRTGNGPVGIWCWNSVGVTIQHCVSHDNRSPGLDGGGFDLDGGATRCVLQHNLSYHNQGTGYLLCQYAGANPWRDNVVSFNISYEDGSRNFHSGIAVWVEGKDYAGVEVSNNTIINLRYGMASGQELPGLIVRDNIFITGEEALTGSFVTSRFVGNCWWQTGKAAFIRRNDGSQATWAEWLAEVHEATDFAATDPRLHLPTADVPLPTDPAGLVDMHLFRPLPGSPCVGIRGNPERFIGALGPLPPR